MWLIVMLIVLAYVLLTGVAMIGALWQETDSKLTGIISIPFGFALGWVMIPLLCGAVLCKVVKG